ncbi:ATP-dependent nuclease [Lysinibacillus pakistanensis]|uniref:ATP-dependent nuclease n=1 Tax=Lysinibacillus pakistanensis TaxID=759811 RepID=UPI003D2C1D00
MKIDTIEIKDFRIFKDTKIQLGSNLTCISGYNGVGKSTLLAILSNVGELKKELGTHINGNAFRGEFSEIVIGDRTYDTTGEKCIINFSELPNKENPENPFVPSLAFRSFFQKTKKTKTITKKVDAIVDGQNMTLTIQEKTDSENYRYRFIPVKTEERHTESKLIWPTYYLGLSRLYPIGESNDVQSKNNIPSNIHQEMMDWHKHILSSDENYLESSSIQITDVKNKKGYGIKTDLYSETMNSSGQDNLGQILSSVFSFKLLQESLKEDYNGGILLIDEIDATIHPAAQNKLIDFLYDKSIEYNIQIVFTTHSLSLLEHIVKKRTNTKNEKSIQLVYLTNKRNKLEVAPNPTRIYLHNDLMQTYSGAIRSRKISVFTEDDTGRWFLEKILEYHKSSYQFDLNLIDMNLGWNQIIKLIKNDFSYYKNHLVILDPDLNSPEVKADLIHHLRGTQYKLDKKECNIIILPGNTFIEKLFWCYLENLEADDEFFYDTVIDESGINKQSLIDYGPNSDEYIEFTDDKKRIKKWFEQNKWICDVAFDYWIKDPNNNREVASFINKLMNAYNPIYHRSR